MKVFTAKQKTLTVNGARILTADLEPEALPEWPEERPPWTVHVIDRVLTPVRHTVLQIVEQSGTFTCTNRPRLRIPH